MSRSNSINADASATGPASVLKALHRHFVRRFVTEEHVCYPPQTGVTWRVAASADALFPDAYLCPECGQCFRPLETTPAAELA